MAFLATFGAYLDFEDVVRLWVDDADDHFDDPLTCLRYLPEVLAVSLRHSCGPVAPIGPCGP